VKDEHGGVHPAQFRYGAVLALELALLVFIIVAPVANWSRAVAVALSAGALMVAFGTSRTHRHRRRARVLAVAGTALVLMVGLVAGAVPAAVAEAFNGALALAVPLALIGGLLRLVGERGVTLQAVAGALAIYLQVGLLFAWVIALATRLTDKPYFQQGTDGTQSDHVYFSFTTLTTTGYGDLTAGYPFGRALAVVEMLTGQLYLVTVIGVLVGGLARRRSG
jgi:hypothetical protein